MDYIRRDEVLWIQGVHSRLMIIGTPKHHQLNDTKFFVILQARPSIRSNNPSSPDDITGGAVGKIIFRQVGNV